MTRPDLVRADTIDLQNRDAPSTQDHAAGLQHPSDLGPHQASELRHVMDERHSEEETLHDAWSNAPDDMQLNDGQSQAHHESGGENGESADEELDDDMLDDRMSSSPSIDDGAYPPALPTSAWPPRSSSLTPTRQTLNRSATATPDSSPFVLPPTHLPLSVTAESPGSPASTQLSSSPFLHPPQHLPLSASPSSKHHHRTGEYELDGEYDHSGFHEYDDISSGSRGDDGDRLLDDRITQGLSVSWGKSVRDLAALPDPELDRPDENDIRDLLLPDNDPLLDYSLGQRPLSPSSWSTVSDASTTSNPETHDLQPRNRGDGDNDDDADDFSFYSDDRFVDSGWGGECLRETEDIDFDFVYALHTFIATVEGQANASKGDTMVLLDDTNSYWWLVRIVKDSSIGYLPAEHIETPTERLARLNKHRNVDLSAAMLGDSAKESKNPLKKAMKRRNAKTVQFTAPTYVEASDYDYSSDEDEDLVPEPLYASGQQGDSERPVDSIEQDQASDIATTVVEAPRGETPDPASPAADMKAPVEEPSGSPTLIDKTEAAPLKSRKGTIRNADSFLKDDGSETRKITLTPNLLRDDGSGGSRSLDTVAPSMESLEKSASPPDKVKEEKKKKEKKPGMLSGLFKSKKKNNKKSSVDEDSDMEKLSGEHARQTAGSESPKHSPTERSSAFPEPRPKGKLQKAQAPAPAAASSPITAPAPADAPAAPPVAPPVAAAPAAYAPIRRVENHEPTTFVAELEGSKVETAKAHGDTLLGSTTLSSISNKIRPSDSQDSLKPKKVKKAKKRVELDDFDEVSDEEENAEEQEREASVDRAPSNAFMHGTEMVHIPMNLGDGSSSPDGTETAEDRGGEESSSDTTSSPSMIDTPKASSEGEREDEQKQDVQVQELTDDDPTPVPSERQSMVSSSLQSPQLTPKHSIPPVRRAPSPPQRSSSATPSIGSSARMSPSPISARSPASTTGTTASWSDSSLRAWLDGTENDVRDMLVIIHDKSTVVPVSRDHPLMANLFVDESRKLAGLQDELDGLLGGYLARKKSIRSS